jgi:hypothetical protein
VDHCYIRLFLFTFRSKCYQLKNTLLAAMTKLGMYSPAEKLRVGSSRSHFPQLCGRSRAGESNGFLIQA